MRRRMLPYSSASSRTSQAASGASSTSRSPWSAHTRCATSGRHSAKSSPRSWLANDFWGHSDLDVVFGRIRDHLPVAAFEADKILFNGNFSLYRNSAETAGWYRHEVGKVTYRDAMTNPAAMHFDERAGIYYIVEDLGAPAWHEDVIFDISFRRYRTRAEAPPGRDPRRYAWENGEVCEYRLERGRPMRRTA